MWLGPSHNIFALVQPVFEVSWLTFVLLSPDLEGNHQSSEKSARIGYGLAGKNALANLFSTKNGWVGDHGHSEPALTSAPSTGCLS
jgi:hypothetical protein